MIFQLALLLWWVFGVALTLDVLKENEQKSGLIDIPVVLIIGLAAPALLFISIVNKK